MAAKSETTTTTKTVYNHAWTWINMHTNMLPPGWLLWPDVPQRHPLRCLARQHILMPIDPFQYEDWDSLPENIVMPALSAFSAFSWRFLSEPRVFRSGRLSCDGVRVVCKTKSRNLWISYWVSEALSPVHSNLESQSWDGVPDCYLAVWQNLLWNQLFPKMQCILEICLRHCQSWPSV